MNKQDFCGSFRRAAVCACRRVGAGFRWVGQRCKLVPAPKEVQLRDGGFHVGPRTKIFVLLGHQSEDRIAAETLAEEVADQSGLKLDILGMKAAGKAEDGAIVLARLQDSRVRRFLARNGLKADDVVGEDGYLLFSDNSHLIVAANTGQGLFYGVQTLRQLLRPAGKGSDVSGGGDSRLAEPGIDSGVGEKMSLSRREASRVFDAVRFCRQT